MSDEGPRFTQHDEQGDEVEAHTQRFTANDEPAEEPETNDEVEAHHKRELNKSDHHRAL